MFYKYDKGYINIKKIIQIVKMSDGAVVYPEGNKCIELSDDQLEELVVCLF